VSVFLRRLAPLAAVGVGMAFVPPSAQAAPLYRSENCGDKATQTELNICSYANLKAADAALNRLYARLMTQQGSRAEKDRLKAAERAWLAYRDAECAFAAGPREEGGTMWPLEMNGCLQRKTDARLRELQFHLDCPSEEACPATKQAP
jgi:uncharacterized protein YecT (DUF1311 family)